MSHRHGHPGRATVTRDWLVTVSVVTAGVPLTVTVTDLFL